MKNPRSFRVGSAFVPHRMGFTLVEMLFYIGLMTIIMLALVQSLSVVLKSNRISFAENNIRNSAYAAMEGMIREIHSSDSVVIASAGTLQMNQNGGANVVKFATSSNSALDFYEGAVTPILIGPLTPRGVLVKSLIFTKISTGKSQAVRIKMQLESTSDGQTKSEWFYGTAILRGSY